MPLARHVARKQTWHEHGRKDVTVCDYYCQTHQQIRQKLSFGKYLKFVQQYFLLLNCSLTTRLSVTAVSHTKRSSCTWTHDKLDNTKEKTGHSFFLQSSQSKWKDKKVLGKGINDHIGACNDGHILQVLWLLTQSLKHEWNGYLLELSLPRLTLST